jgi:hypothetical protein
MAGGAKSPVGRDAGSELRQAKHDGGAGIEAGGARLCRAPHTGAEAEPAADRARGTGRNFRKEVARPRTYDARLAVRIEPESRRERQFAHTPMHRHRKGASTFSTELLPALAEQANRHGGQRLPLHAERGLGACRAAQWRGDTAGKQKRR